KSGGHMLSCDELASQDDYERASVTRSALEKAIREAFGTGRHRKDSVIIVVAANERGIHPVAGEKRKANLVDEIDRMADAFFGSGANVGHFLRVDRFE